MEMKKIEIFTDGSSLGNPGPGGYAAIVCYKGIKKELSQGYRRTTNNRMEMMGAIASLSALKERCSVTIYTDSQYLADGISKGWAIKWRQRGWIKSNKERALNVDLWSKLLDLLEYHQVEFKWLRGHAGHPENERCDKLAKEAATAPNLLIDKDYEESSLPTPGER